MPGTPPPIPPSRQAVSPAKSNDTQEQQKQREQRERALKELSESIISGAFIQDFNNKKLGAEFNKFLDKYRALKVDPKLIQDIDYCFNKIIAVAEKIQQKLSTSKNGSIADLSEWYKILLENENYKLFIELSDLIDKFGKIAQSVSPRNTEFKSQTIEGVLASPFQILFKCPLLLAEIIKHTPTNEQVPAPIVELHKQFKNLLADANAHKKYLEDLKKSSQIKISRSARWRNRIQAAFGRESSRQLMLSFQVAAMAGELIKFFSPSDKNYERYRQTTKTEEVGKKVETLLSALLQETVFNLIEFRRWDQLKPNEQQRTIQEFKQRLGEFNLLATSLQQMPSRKESFDRIVAEMRENLKSFSEIRLNNQTLLKDKIELNETKNLVEGLSGALANLLTDRLTASYAARYQQIDIVKEPFKAYHLLQEIKKELEEPSKKTPSLIALKDKIEQDAREKLGSSLEKSAPVVNEQKARSKQVEFGENLRVNLQRENTRLAGMTAALTEQRQQRARR